MSCAWVHPVRMHLQFISNRYEAVRIAPNHNMNCSKSGHVALSACAGWTDQSCDPLPVMHSDAMTLLVQSICAWRQDLHPRPRMGGCVCRRRFPEVVYVFITPACHVHGAGSQSLIGFCISIAGTTANSGGASPAPDVPSAQLPSHLSLQFLPPLVQFSDYFSLAHLG